MSGVRMREGRPFAQNAAPGTVQAHHSAEGLQHAYLCPCGCGQVYNARHAVQSGSVAGGDLTLTPSLWHNGQGQCGWHGWLRDGVFSLA